MKIKLIKDNPYGYKLDISDPDINRLYVRYKRWRHIPPWCPLSDDERREFEGYILNGKKENTENG